MVMSSFSDFDLVIQSFEAVNPEATVLLSSLPKETAHISYTCEEENFYDASVHPHVFLHDPSGPLKEAMDWVSSYQVDKVEVLVVYGIGMGHCYEALRPFLAKNSSNRLIFIEDNLEVIYAFLHSSKAKSFFQDPQVTLFYVGSEALCKEVLETIAFNVYIRPWSCIPSPGYGRYKKESFEKFSTRLSLLQLQVTDLFVEFFSPGDSPLLNFGRNLFLWPKSKNGSFLFGKFTGIPAVVVGAGPSLQEQIPLLQKLSSSCIIIAGGSAVPALLQAGIVPHFAATVDPNATQYIRMRQAQVFCLPLFYRSRALHECLMFHQGPLLYLKGGDGYPLIDYFEEDLHISGETLEGGHSVSNMIIELAAALGCSTIILAGYDLSYPKGKLYALSVSEALLSGETTEKNSEKMLFPAKSVTGDMIETEEKWITEGSWISKFAEQFPECTLVQTSPEGLYIDGLTHMSFKEAVDAYCTKTFDVESQVHVAIQEAPILPVTCEKIAFSMKKMAQSVEETIAILQDMYRYLKEKDCSLESERWFLLEESLKQQIAYVSVLSMYEAMHAKLMQKKSLLECRPYNDKEAEKKFEKEAENSRIALFLDMAYSYRKFFSSIVSWACANGYELPQALEIAQYAEGAALPRKFFSL